MSSGDCRCVRDVPAQASQPGVAPQNPGPLSPEYANSGALVSAPAERNVPRPVSHRASTPTETATARVLTNARPNADRFRMMFIMLLLCPEWTDATRRCI